MGTDVKPPSGQRRQRLASASRLMIRSTPFFFMCSMSKRYLVTCIGAGEMFGLTSQPARQRFV
jgi:hypothetical protein